MYIVLIYDLYFKVYFGFERNELNLSFDKIECDFVIEVYYKLKKMMVNEYHFCLVIILWLSLKFRKLNLILGGINNN